MIKKVDHIGIAVDEIEAAMEFYRKGLGIELECLETVEDQSVRLAMLPAGESALELIQPVAGDSGVRKWLDKRGEGIHHICLEVDDLPATLAHLESAGYQLIDRQPRRGLHGKIAFVHPKSAHGVLIELIEKDHSEE